MADVEKININSTDYDIADAKALRNKNTAAASSFIDTRAGTQANPTGGANLSNCSIIGNASYVIPTTANGIIILGSSSFASAGAATIIGNTSQAGMQSVTIGNSAGNNSYSYTVNVGCNSKSTGSDTVAIGESSSAANSSVAIGKNAKANSNYGTTIGASATNSSMFSVLIGHSAQNLGGQFNTVVGSGSTTRGSNYNTVLGAASDTGTSASYNVICGSNSTIPNYVSYASSLGASANARSNYSVQLGAGNNYNYGSLQFRDWPLVNSSGKIYEERLPDSIKTASPTFPNLYDINEEKVSEQAILYTGATNDSYTNSQFYRGRVRYGYPRFNCSWADTDWLDSQNDVTIDQQKFFTKLAEVTKQRIDNNDVENGLIGGDNSEQSIYLYYDADNDYYLLRFDSDSFEKAFNGTPDDITGLSFDDLADYGIYFRNFHKPSDLEGEYEFCDIYYYAPVYIDSYDWNSNPSYINYFQFLEAMNDSDWGIGYVIPNKDEWSFEVDGTTYYCPIIPKTYEYNGDEYDNVEFRWEWNDNDEKWKEYINGEDIGRSRSTAEMYTTFGIKIQPGEESNIEYIGLTVRGGDQRYWDQFDPVDSANFCTKQEKQDMQGDINRLKNNSFRLIQNARNLNDFTTSGAYHIQASGCTNLPSTASASKDIFLFVTRTDANNVKQVLITDYVNKSSGGMNYGTYCSNMYVRTLSGGTWRSWEVILTPDDLMFLPGFDKTKKQVIGHNADGTTITWQESSGGSYSEGSGIDITGNVISVDDLDCGTM